MANGELLIFRSCKFKDRLKLTVYFLAGLRYILLRLVGKINIRQCIRRVLYLHYQTLFQRGDFSLHLLNL